MPRQKIVKKKPAKKPVKKPAKKKSKNVTKNFITKIVNMFKKIKLSKKKNVQNGGGYKDDVVKLLQKQLKEKGIAELIFDDVEQAELAPMKEFTNKAYKEDVSSYARVHFMLKGIHQIFDNNLDLKYPLLRKLAIEKLYEISEKKFKDYKEMKELIEQLNDSVIDIDDLPDDWRYGD